MQSERGNVRATVNNEKQKGKREEEGKEKLAEISAAGA